MAEGRCGGVCWTKFATGQTGPAPGVGYWVGIQTRADQFRVSVAYDEVLVGHYDVGSETEACVIRAQLLQPRRGVAR